MSKPRIALPKSIRQPPWTQFARVTKFQAWRAVDALAAYPAAILRLLETEGFLAFFRQATPIDIIKEATSDSSITAGWRADARRPPRHPLGVSAGVNHALTCPDGTAWAMPSVGCLQSIPGSSPFSHRISTRGRPLHYALSNASTCLAAADPGVMSQYACWWRTLRYADKFLPQIIEELERTSRMLEHIYGGSLAERRPNIDASLGVRRQPLRVLHRQQVALLRDWCGMRQRGDDDGAAALLPGLLLTVNAIASGLGATG